jgi:hypothetical protein
MSSLMHVAQESPWRCSSHFWESQRRMSHTRTRRSERGDTHFTSYATCPACHGKKKKDTHEINATRRADGGTTDQQPPVLVDAVRGRLTACRAGVPRELGSERKPSSESAIARDWDEGELEDEDGEVGVVCSDMSRAEIGHACT